jgi:hypothetical protein
LGLQCIHTALRVQIDSKMVAEETVCSKILIYLYT